MDLINDVAHTITDQILPHVAKQMNCCYLIFMTIQACKTQDYSWHKANWLLSYTKALIYGFGADIILAILTGHSSMEAMSVNRSFLLIALAWWLYLFMPYSVFYKFVHLKVGDVEPLYLIMVVFASARRMVKAEAAVAACLAGIPGSYISILAGTLVANGTLFVATFFGDFATAISNKTTTYMALTASILFTLVKMGVVTWISPSLALASAVVFAIFVESLEACNHHFRGFEYIHDGLGKIIATKDLVGRK